MDNSMTRRVVKVNKKTVKVEQIEARGEKPVGTVWNVSRSLCWKQGEGAGFVRVEPKPKPVPVSSLKRFRTESAIMVDIAAVYNQLSPENLFADGEIPYHVGIARSKILKAKLEGLFLEIGRRVSEDEAFASVVGG